MPTRLYNDADVNYCGHMIHPPMSIPPPVAVTDSGKRRRLVGQYQKRIKKVRFADKNEVRDFQRHVDPQRLWFRNQELQDIRSRGKGLALEISTNPQMKDHYLSYKNVIEGVYKKAIQGSLTSKPDKGLIVWVQHGHSRRGLERWSVPFVGIYRQERRNALVHSLLIVQRQLLPDKEGVLRQLSEHYSSPSKLFAQTMAAADAHAADAYAAESREQEIHSSIPIVN